MRRQRLVDARKAAGLTQEDIAIRVDVDRTTIGKWERGESTPHPQQRPRYAEALGIAMDELDGMLSTIPPGGNETPDWLSTYLGMEQSATSLLAHEQRAIHGMFQTPAYVEHLVSRVGVAGMPDTYLQRTVEQRLYRQKRVRDGDLVLDVVQPESALHLRVGDASVMADQLATLAELAARPNVTVRIITYDAGNYMARRLGDFVIMSHPWGRPRVHVEGYSGGQFITDADEVAYFAAALDHASRIALTPQDSLRFIQEQADRWRAHDV